MLKSKLLIIVVLVTLSTGFYQATIRNTIDTNYTYNGEENPDFNKIDLNDWDKWCDTNSEYTRIDSNGYKNKYFIDKEEYNFGICALSIDG